jgi:hypothetical protein
MDMEAQAFPWPFQTVFSVTKGISRRMSRKLGDIIHMVKVSRDSAQGKEIDGRHKERHKPCGEKQCVLGRSEERPWRDLLTLANSGPENTLSSPQGGCQHKWGTRENKACSVNFCF